MPKAKFNLSTGPIKTHPAAAVSDWRQTGDVVQTKIAFLGETHVALSHAACRDVLKRTDLFKTDPNNVDGAANVTDAWWLPKFIKPLTQNMLLKDEPDHTRLRKLVDQAFSRRGMEALHGLVERRADMFINTLPRNAPFDFVELYARDFPLSVICDMLGVPTADTTQFKATFRKFNNTSNPLSMMRGLWGMRGLMRYMHGHIEHLRHEPNDGLISDLIHAHDDGNHLSNDELIAMVFLLFTAGHETTTHLLSGGVAAFLDHPDQRDAFLSDPALRPLAVEETLRFVSPVQMTKPRVVAQDIQFHGAQLKQGDQIIALLVGANFGTTHFENADQFDITRRANSHMSFGGGPHFCLGFQLARLEAQVTFEKLFERFPDLRRADENADTYTKRIGIRALNRLDLIAS